MSPALGVILIILAILCVTAVLVYSLVLIMGKSNAAKILQYNKNRRFFIYEMLSAAFVGGTVLRDLHFPVFTKDGIFDTDVDIVCVTRGGVAVIEIKGGRGVVDCPATGLWRQRFDKKERKFQNPRNKNQEDIRAIVAALKKVGITNVPIIGYVVFSDTKAKFTEKYPWLKRADEILDVLETLDDRLLLTRRDQKIIAQVMKNHKRRKNPPLKHRLKIVKGKNIKR